MSKRSPRLQFFDEERASPELKKVIEKADKKADKLDKAEAKIPKKTVKRKERVVGEDGKVSVKLHFEEVDKKKPTSKLTHSLTDAPLNTVLATAHREVRDSEEDNVGVEGAHKLEQVAEGGVRTLDSAHRSHKLKPYREAAYAEKAADKANLKALNKQAQQNNPQFSSNPYSRWQQKRAIKKEYMAAKAGKTGATTAKATQKTAKSAKKAAENTKKTGTFLARHWKGALIVLALLLMIAFLSSVISSCSVLVQSGVTSFAASSYISEVVDMSELFAITDTAPLRTAQAQKVQRQLDKKHEEYEKLQKLLMSLYENLADGIIDREEYTRLKASFSARADEAEKQMDALREQLEDIYNHGTENAWMNEFIKRQGLTTLDRAVVVALIDKILIHSNDVVEIIYRWQDEFAWQLDILRSARLREVV